MKIAIDTFGCDHAKSGWGSYLYYFIKNIPSDSKFKHSYELFGSEIDRYTYTSEVEKTFQSVNIKDDLKTEQRWHRHWVDAFIRKNNYDLVIYPAVEKVIPGRFSTPSIAVMNSILSVVKKNSSFKIRHQLQKGLENVQCIIAPSQYIKNDLIANKIDAEKIHVIYNGIDHKLFFPSSDIDTEYVEIKPFAIKRPYFIYGSRLSGPEKKHIELIRAFNIFKKETDSPIRLVLAGNDGEWSDKIKKEAYESDYSSDIFITGYFPHESFSKLYAGATACIFPAVNEGVGLPILESMACGIPVLCSDSGALPEVGADAPIYFNSDDVNDIAQKMKQIVQDKKLYQEKVDAGLKRANHFNWDSTVINTISIAEELFKKN